MKKKIEFYICYLRFFYAKKGFNQNNYKNYTFPCYAYLRILLASESHGRIKFSIFLGAVSSCTRTCPFNLDGSKVL